MSLQLENVFFCCKTCMEAHGSCIFTQKNLQILTKTSNTIFSSRDLQFKQNELVFINFVPCIVSKNIKKVFPNLHGIYHITYLLHLSMDSNIYNIISFDNVCCSYQLQISMEIFWVHKIWLCFIAQRIAKYLGAGFLGFGSF